MQEVKVFSKKTVTVEPLSFEEGLKILQGSSKWPVMADVFLRWKTHNPPRSFSNFKQLLDVLESPNDSMQRKSFLARIVEHAFLLFDFEEQVCAFEVVELFERFDFYFKCNSKLIETLINHLHPTNLEDIPDKWFTNPSLMRSYGLRSETSTAKIVERINQAGLNIEDYAPVLLVREELNFQLVLQLLQTKTEERTSILLEHRLLSEEELHSLPAKVVMMVARWKAGMNPTWFETDLTMPVYDRNLLAMSKMVEEAREEVGDEFWSAFEHNWEGTLAELCDTHQEIGK